MAYGVATRMYFSAEPIPPVPDVERSSLVWRQLRADERLRAVDRVLKKVA